MFSGLRRGETSTGKDLLIEVTGNEAAFVDQW
ncbi:hypothetical protein RKD52_002067 [Metabacillus sp. SLBN-84]